MVDFSFIGREGLIIQWDDVIAMIGYNVARYLKSKGYKNDKLCKMSNEDILLSYINRPNEDPAIWLKENFDIEFDLSRYKDSIVTWQPNWAYPYRIIKAANDNKLQNLCIYYEKDIPIIRRYVETFDAPVEYLSGDISKILSEKVNYTFITASPTNIRKCLDLEVPLAITIVDDFMPIADIVIEDVATKLREKNKFVNFTGIVSAGLI